MKPVNLKVIRAPRDPGSWRWLQGKSKERGKTGETKGEGTKNHPPVRVKAPSKEEGTSQVS